MSHTETHKSSDLLAGPTFYDYDHALNVDGRPHKITAVHRPETSTAHYWDGKDPSDILLSVRPAVVTAHGIVITGGPTVKVMVSENQELTAMLANG